MIVTEIRPVTKKRSQVYVEGQPAFVLYNGELSRYHIREGEEIPLSIWEEITGELLIKRSRKRALNLLLKGDRTRSQLLQKLQTDGYPMEIAEQAVEYAESFGYIDDRRYAENYLNGPGAKKSRMAARIELTRKGIDPELIDRLMEEQMETEEDSEREKVRTLAWKCLGPAHRLNEKEYRRIYSYLARRGFTSSDILSVLEEYQKNTLEYDE